MPPLRGCADADNGKSLNLRRPHGSKQGEGRARYSNPMVDSAGYLHEIRDRLSPALVAYTSDARNHAILDEARDVWLRDCEDTGISDCAASRAAAISVLMPFVGGSTSADDMHDRAATMIMAIMSGADPES